MRNCLTAISILATALVVADARGESTGAGSGAFAGAAVVVLPPAALDVALGIHALYRDDPVSKPVAFVEVVTMPTQTALYMYLGVNDHPAWWLAAAYTGWLTVDGIHGVARPTPPKTEAPFMTGAASLFTFAVATAPLYVDRWEHDRLLCPEGRTELCTHRDARLVLAAAAPGLAVLPSLPRWLGGDRVGAAIFTGLRIAFVTTGILSEEIFGKQHEGHADATKVIMGSILGYAVPAILGVVDLATTPATGTSTGSEFPKTEAAFTIVPTPMCNEKGCSGLGLSLAGAL